MGLAPLIGAGELPRALDELCATGPSIRAVTRDPAWLIPLLSRPDSGPIQLDLISPKRPWLAPGDGPGDRWHWTRVRELPPPEYLLFGPTNSEFPNAALVLIHSPEPGAWAALYTRPLVLDRLLRRFRALKRRAIDLRAPSPSNPPVVPAVREPEGRSAPPRTLHPDLPGEPGPATRIVPPDTLYARILASHFGGRLTAADTGPSGVDLAPHQERAYERARDILERYGGVLIADAVGLGKTYIALRFIEDALDGNGALVVVPAALRHDWQDSIARLRSPTGRRRGSRPEDPSEDDNLDLWVREPGRRIPGIRIASTESLGQQTFDPGRFQPELVVVDEAHRFRNPLTRRYRNLSELARQARVVLLTATPINNSIADLEALLSLFAEPGAFRHLGIDDYRNALRGAVGRDDRVGAIVSACVVRRTRQFLRRHYGDIRIPDPGTGEAEPMRFPERRPPVAVHYDLREVYGRGMPELESWLESLTFPRPPVEATGTSVQDAFHGAPGLLQVVLLKRLESSLDAFRRTLVQQLAWCRTALNALDAGRVLTRPEYRSSFRGPTDDPGSQLALVELMLPAPDISARLLERYRELLESDLRQLERMHRSLHQRSAHRDQKFRRLAELLDGRLAGRKILLFTEFRDTAHYLYRALSDRPHLGLIHSGRAMLGRQRASRREVIERFAPFSNGRPEPPEIERVDLLIATDVASEGLNLQDASIVISYDLPWNPVRLMQRMGRIDRLGSRHEYVELYHFVPDADLDRLLGLMDRLQDKIRTIAATMGLDSLILGTEDEGPEPHRALRGLVTGTADWHEIDERLEGPVDPEEQAYLDFRRLSDNRTVEVGRPGSISIGTMRRGQARAAAYWIIATRPPRRLWLIQAATGEVREDPATAVEILRSARPAGSSLAEARIARARHAFAAYVESECRRLAALTIAGERLPSHLPQYRLAAWLTRSLASEAARAPLQASTDLDGILDRLGRRYLPADERLLQRLLDERPERPDADFLARLESVLARMRGREAPGMPAGAIEVGTLVLADGTPDAIQTLFGVTEG